MKTVVILLYITIFFMFFYAVLNAILRSRKTSLSKIAKDELNRVKTSTKVMSWRINKETKLIKHGVDIFSLKDGFSLTKWYVNKALYASILALMGTFLNVVFTGGMYLSITIAVLVLFGYFLPDIMLHYQNDASNKDMMSDIMEMSRSVLYSNRGGQYITKSISDAMLVVENERLKIALLKLKYNIDSQKSLSEAIDEFESHFDNAEISAFCTVIRSLQETGQVNDALHTLRTNIEREQLSVNKRRCQKLESKTQMNCMLVFVGIILCLIYILFVFVASVVSGF